MDMLDETCMQPQGSEQRDHKIKECKLNPLEAKSRISSSNRSLCHHIYHSILSLTPHSPRELRSNFNKAIKILCCRRPCPFISLTTSHILRSFSISLRRIRPCPVVPLAVSHIPLSIWKHLRTDQPIVSETIQHTTPRALRTGKEFGTLTSASSSCKWQHPAFSPLPT